MTQVDDLLQRRPEQIPMTLVSRLAHRESPRLHRPPRESRSTRNRNPKSQEIGLRRAPSCKLDYFRNALASTKSQAGELFTDDYVAKFSPKTGSEVSIY
jgi:hypothetical protein